MPAPDRRARESLDLCDPYGTYTAILFDGESFWLLKTDGALYDTVDASVWSFYAAVPNSSSGNGRYVMTGFAWAPSCAGGEDAFIVSRLYIGS